MIGYLLRKIGYGLAVMLGIVVVVFFLFNILPVDPARMTQGQRADAPFGHAGHRLVEWMFATRFGAPIMGATGGSEGVDDAMAQQHEPGIGARRHIFKPQHVVSGEPFALAAIGFLAHQQRQVKGLDHIDVGIEHPDPPAPGSARSNR